MRLQIYDLQLAISDFFSSQIANLQLSICNLKFR